ncbi:hypothetical protein ACFOEK_17840 [Litoribrevibacter euphylliae]|uniref:Uncharacterized protein n=1 Tax=Litoribrevibacter euphylliae TaxID=1834034 RepID=A0ABV7HN39_9GAMM
MDWPTVEDCHDAMTKFVEYYMEGEQKGYWQSLIKECQEEGRFPAGKAFLHEIDQVIRNSSKSRMPKTKELYEVICVVCI